MEGQKFLEYARTQGLFAHKITKVKTKVERQEKRLLMEFSATPSASVENELVIQEEDLSFTNQYIELTRDYYLGLKKK
jgi:tRNA1(Val) A37 N6-methylase TrmN6